MVKVALNDHLSLFRFQTAGIPKIKQEEIKLKIFFNFTIAEIARRFRKKSGHTQIFFPRSRLRAMGLLRGKICQSQSLSTDWLASC